MQTSLHHVHLLAEDKYVLAAWYEKYLGYKIIADIEKLGEKGGPLYISADNGRTALSLFNRKARHHGVSINSKPAFGLTAEDLLTVYKNFVSSGEHGDLIFYDHQVFCSFYVRDPDGTEIELTTSEHEQMRVLLRKNNIVCLAENPTAEK